MSCPPPLPDFYFTRCYFGVLKGRVVITPRVRGTIVSLADFEALFAVTVFCTSSSSIMVGSVYTTESRGGFSFTRRERVAAHRITLFSLDCFSINVGHLIIVFSCTSSVLGCAVQRRVSTFTRCAVSLFPCLLFSTT